MTGHKTYFALLVLAGCSSLVLTPCIIKLASYFGVVDRPGVRKIHQRPIPLLGGLVIALSMWLSLGAFGLHSNLVRTLFLKNYDVALRILLSGLTMLLVGVIDDVRGLNAKQKFILQIPVAIILVSLGMRFEGVTIPGVGSIQLNFLGPILSVLWLVGITNAINLVDGVDGLATGVALFAAATNALIAILNDSVVPAVIMTALAGACFGFLPYNFNPARIFLGDTGSLFLGMTLAVSSMFSAQKGITATSMLIPILILGYPIIDTLLSMTRRAIRGKSIFAGDAGHIHHRLLHHGWTQRQTSIGIYALCGLCSLVAILTVMHNDLGIAIGFAGLFFVLYTGLRTLGYWKTLLSVVNGSDRLRFKALYHYAELAKCKIGLAENRWQLAEILQALSLEFGKEGLFILIPGEVPFQYRWLKNDHPDLINGSTLPASFEVESHHFDNGVKIDFYFHPGDDGDEFHLEKGNLMGPILDATTNRISYLIATGSN